MAGAMAMIQYGWREFKIQSPGGKEIDAAGVGRISAGRREKGDRAYWGMARSAVSTTWASIALSRLTALITRRP